MKAFYTDSSHQTFPHIMHVLEQRWGRHPLFTRDVAQMVFHYTLFDSKKHTVEEMCRDGNLCVVKYLVEEHGADVHVSALLYTAAENGHLDIVKYLVEEHGADVHADNEYALRWAANNGHLDVVKYLVEERGADVHAQNEKAMKWAAEYGHLDVVKYLVEEHGADIHADNEGALRWATCGYIQTRNINTFITVNKTNR